MSIDPHLGQLFYDQDGQPISFDRWSELFADESTRFHLIAKVEPDITVSTAWTGINVEPNGATPLVFETLVMGGDWHQSMWRWPSRAEAERAHERIVALVRLAAMYGREGDAPPEST